MPVICVKDHIDCRFNSFSSYYPESYRPYMYTLIAQVRTPDRTLYTATKVVGT